MRMSNLFVRTLREAPSQVVLTSHKLLARAGYLQEIGKGGFTILPFGLRAIQNMEQTFLTRLDTETTLLELPAVLSHEGSSTSGAGPGFIDPQGRQLKLPSNPDIIMDEITRQHFTSYRQLPAFLYSHDTFWDDEVHPGSGPLYGRQPRTLSLYGFFQQAGERAQWQEQISAALDKWLSELDIPIIRTCNPEKHWSADPVEWYFRHPSGRTTIYSCLVCGYTASQHNVKFWRHPPWDETPQPAEKVRTPGCKTIEALAAFLDIPKERTAKAVFLMATLSGKEQFVIVIIPGDRELDEQRLAEAAGLTAWRPAAEDEVAAAGAVPGYGSPVNVRDVYVVVDTQIPLSPNLVAGANEPEYHLLNVNCGRDYTASLVADITHPQPGDCCPHCHETLHSESGVPVAKLSFPTGGHVVMDAKAKITPLYTLACRISSLRLLAAAAEMHSDEHGLVMPFAASPFKVHLVLLPDKEGRAQVQADALYEELLRSGIEPLYDDRNERAGVKFNDADLIGIPIRITISQRGLNNGVVELKFRQNGEPQQIPLAETLPLIQRLLIQ
ncbi:MAG: hypothetical protein LLG42_05445 [Chloroflexi bacterium]|nr:hypothetical protein [Chloroflexota bacterium]